MADGRNRWFTVQVGISVVIGDKLIEEYNIKNLGNADKTSVFVCAN